MSLTRYNINDPEVLDSIVNFSNNQSMASCRSSGSESEEMGGIPVFTSTPQITTLQNNSPAQSLLAELEDCSRPSSRMQSSTPHMRISTHGRNLDRQSFPPRQTQQHEASRAESDFEQSMRGFMSSIGKDVATLVGTNKQTAEDISSLRESNSALQRRMDDLEKRITTAPPAISIPMNNRRRTVPSKVSRHVSQVYLSDEFHYRSDEAYNSRFNQGVKGRIVAELKAKWEDSVTDKEIDAAAHNKYRSARSVYLAQENNSTNELKLKRKLTASKHRKLQSRKNTASNESDKLFWGDVGVDLMSDEEEGPNDLIRFTLTCPFRSRLLEEKIKEADKKIKQKITKTRIEKIQTKNLKKIYSLDYVNLEN